MSENFFPPFAIGVLVFLIGTGVAILRTGAFPRWLAWVVIVGAVFAITPLFPVAMLVLGLFTLIASVLLSMATEGATASTRT